MVSPLTSIPVPWCQVPFESSKKESPFTAIFLVPLLLLLNPSGLIYFFPPSPVHYPRSVGCIVQFVFDVNWKPKALAASQSVPFHGTFDDMLELRVPFRQPWKELDNLYTLSTQYVHGMHFGYAFIKYPRNML